MLAVVLSVLTTAPAGIPTATAHFTVVVTTSVMVSTLGMATGRCAGGARHTQSDGGHRR
jgi:hypothetical protein